MIERFLHQVRVDMPAADETAAGARERLGPHFPRSALRRMTHLGLLVGSVLRDATFGPDDAIVYASTFAETRALEDYLGGLPDASPLLFQTSIHPGAIQQVMIARQQPVARLWPMAGCARLVEEALLVAIIEPASRVALVSGEERGTWMLEHKMAAARPFASAILLGNDSAGAIGSIRFVPEGTDAPGPCPTIEAWAHILSERRATAWQGVAGSWQLEWR
jgi:hypothetical protein